MVTTTTRLERDTRAGDVEAAHEYLAHARRRCHTEDAMMACDVLVAAGHWRRALEFYASQAERLAPLTRRERKCPYCYQSSGEYFCGGDDYFAKCRHCNGTGRTQRDDNPPASNGCPDGTHRCDCKPQDTHALCNAIGRLAPLNRRMTGGIITRDHPWGGKFEVWREDAVKHPDNPPAQDVCDLWVKCLRLWDPRGWFAWLIEVLLTTGWYRSTWATGQIPAISYTHSGPVWDISIDSNGGVHAPNCSTIPDLPTVPECVCLAALGVSRGLCPGKCYKGKHLWDANHGDPIYSGCDACKGTGKCPRCG